MAIIQIRPHKKPALGQVAIFFTRFLKEKYWFPRGGPALSCSARYRCVFACPYENPHGHTESLTVGPLYYPILDCKRASQKLDPLAARV